VNHRRNKICQTSGKKCQKSIWIWLDKEAIFSHRNHPYRYPLEINNNFMNNLKSDYYGTVFVYSSHQKKKDLQLSCSTN
jgi:hypothetical protein